MADKLFTFDEQLKRLKEAADVKTDTALAHLLDITQGGFSGARRRGSIPHKWFVAISTRYGVNLEWLVSGTGPRSVELSHTGTCPQCAELQKQLTVANERLYQASERERELLKENGELKAENVALKNKLAPNPEGGAMQNTA